MMMVMVFGTSLETITSDSLMIEEIYTPISSLTPCSLATLLTKKSYRTEFHATSLLSVSKTYLAAHYPINGCLHTALRCGIMSVNRGFGFYSGFRPCLLVLSRDNFLSVACCLIEKSTTCHKN